MERDTINGDRKPVRVCRGAHRAKRPNNGPVRGQRRFDELYRFLEQRYGLPPEIEETERDR